MRSNTIRDTYPEVKNYFPPLLQVKDMLVPENVTNDLFTIHSGYACVINFNIIQLCMRQICENPSTDLVNLLCIL